MPGPMHVTGRTRTRRRRLEDDGHHEAEQQAPPVRPQPVAGLVHDVARREATGADPLGGTAVDGDVADTLRRRSGGGKPLTGSFASALGEQYGADLSAVRVHDDQEADTISRSMQAVAFTHGTDMYFTKGSYDPQSASGQRLIAHEAAHVVQGHAGRASNPGSAPTIGRADDPLEAEADVMADTALAAIRRQASASEEAVSGHGADCTDCVPAGAIHRRVAAGTDLGAVRRQALVTPTGSPVVRRKGFFSKLFDKISGKKPEKEKTKDGEKEPEQGPGETTKPGWTKAQVSESVTESATGPKLGQHRYPAEVTIGTERVQVGSLAEHKEAEAILSEMSTTYGIDVSSGKTIAGIKGEYTDVLEKELKKLTAAVWEMKELRGLLAAAKFYAPILGEAREDSTLSNVTQGVTSVGKLKNAIDQDDVKGKLDTSTLGEYFSSQKNMGMFGAVTNYSDPEILAKDKKKGDNATGILATAIHEMAHGLIQPVELGNWVNTLDFWASRSTKSGEVGAEAPPTTYGRKNAAEDLCESVAMFFINEPLLRKKCPLRADFLKKVVASWTPEVKEVVVDKATNPTGSEKIGV